MYSVLLHTNDGQLIFTLVSSAYYDDELVIESMDDCYYTIKMTKDEAESYIKKLFSNSGLDLSNLVAYVENNYD